MNKVDTEYFRLVKEILTNGRLKQNRTGIKTIGVFGEQAKFDVNLDAFPILTTKKVFFKGILHELLWFIKGDTNIKYLVDNDVHIWDEWGCRRWMQKTGVKGHFNAMLPIYVKQIKEDAEFAKQWGELGEGTYGGMWRAFPHRINPIGYDKGTHMEVKGWEVETVDQLQKVVDKLKTNPDDRRMIVSAWHPFWVDHCALPPCHCLFHFNTEELTFEERWGYAIKIGKHCGVTWEGEQYVTELLDTLNIPRRRLNCLLYQRSGDTGLGIPYNVTSYALLTAMVAQCVNMVPGVFTHTYGDLHIYENHIDVLKLQLTREPMKLPKLWINPEVKDLFSFKFDDIKLIDYVSHPTIKMPVAV